MEKIVKREMYSALVAMADGETFKYSMDDLRAFAQNEIDLLDKKAAKAKERAAAKKAEQDELGEIVKSLLTDEWQTLADLAGQIDGDDVSAAKVQARVKKLIDAGEVEKAQVEIPATETSKKSKKMAYRLIQD